MSVSRDDDFSRQLLRATPEEIERAIDRAINGLWRSTPDFSVRGGAPWWQRLFVLSIVGVMVVGSVANPFATATAVAIVLILLFALITVERTTVVLRGLRVAPRESELTALPTGDLPIYSILLPVLHEPEVVVRLLRAVGDLNYPPERLQLLLLVEADDDVTIAALRNRDLPSSLVVLLVPAGEPRTKPKACNFGLEFATGEFVCIYDAEDIPEPDQLLDAVRAFRLDPEVACLQARLDFFNANQNLMTKWFTIEYLMWFAAYLPGMKSKRLIIPLGGTSNHLRRSVLVDVGGWDPYNVAEDADLGVRLARRGYRTDMLASVTMEEATSDTTNWMRQRSRWHKGYLQTWSLHMRNPQQTVREVGPSATRGLATLIGLTPALAALNVLSGMTALAFLVGLPSPFLNIFPMWLVYVGTAAFILGNALTVFLAMVAMARFHRNDLVMACLGFPAYWILISVAALKATIQLVLRPSYWEKTQHGQSSVAS